MAIHLVRHAKAGSRPDWDGEDETRPLTDEGIVQARTIADALAPLGIDRILTSRYVRCAETVAPLAEKLGIPAEASRSLAEEASLTHVLELLDELLAEPQRNVVLCSHGNILSPILDRLHRRGIELVAEEWTCKKGSVWSIEVDGAGAVQRVVHTIPQA